MVLILFACLNSSPKWNSDSRVTKSARNVLMSKIFHNGGGGGGG
jgi:hypothetical protein